jgi:hypothetical protein
VALGDGPIDADLLTRCGVRCRLQGCLPSDHARQLSRRASASRRRGRTGRVDAPPRRLPGLRRVTWTSTSTGGVRRVAVVERRTLETGDRLAGPCIVEPATTVLVLPRHPSISGQAREPRDRGGVVTTDRFTMDVLREAFFAVTTDISEPSANVTESGHLRGLDCRRLTDTAANSFLRGTASRVPRPARRGRARHARSGSDLVPGDVVATNDPFAGGGDHLSDVAMVRRSSWTAGSPRSRRRRDLDRGRWQGPRVVDRRLGGDLPGGTATAVRPRRPAAASSTATSSR